MAIVFHMRKSQFSSNKSLLVAHEHHAFVCGLLFFFYSSSLSLFFFFNTKICRQVGNAQLHAGQFQEDWGQNGMKRQEIKYERVSEMKTKRDRKDLARGRWTDNEHTFIFTGWRRHTHIHSQRQFINCLSVLSPPFSSPFKRESCQGHVRR